jgi:hypothetical protein
LDKGDKVLFYNVNESYRAIVLEIFPPENNEELRFEVSGMDICKVRRIATLHKYVFGLILSLKSQPI